ncbi:MAG TPA: hypothetical protein PL029_06495 [Bacteroidia bacterium]|nr:hypothetical protein [Bacteroidia bacterium]
MAKTKYLLPLLMIFLCACSAKKTKTNNGNDPATRLYIVQDHNEYPVETSGATINLKAKPFKLCFHTKNTWEVFLHASTDSSAYSKAVTTKWDQLDCFKSDQTFSEPAKNADMEIMVGDNETRGYHCLFAKAEAEFIRFDSVKVMSKREWTGIRTINQMTFLNNSSAVPCHELSGKIIYLTYSPGIVKQGKGIRLRFL